MWETSLPRTSLFSHMQLVQSFLLSSRILLLKRLDIDMSIKDLEGHTAHDLYNSTVRSAKPTNDEETLAELFTWGTNR